MIHINDSVLIKFNVGIVSRGCVVSVNSICEVINLDLLTFEDESEFSWREGDVLKVFKFFLNNIEVPNGDSAIDFFKMYEVEPEKHHSKVAYAENNYGYMFLTKNMMNEVVICFHRWD